MTANVSCFCQRCPKVSILQVWTAVENPLRHIGLFRRQPKVQTCSSPAVRPTCLRWLERKDRGQSDESRANSSQQKRGTPSSPRCMRPCSSTALPSISSLSASSSPSSSSPHWKTRSQSCCRSAAEAQSTAARH